MNAEDRGLGAEIGLSSSKVGPLKVEQVLGGELQFKDNRDLFRAAGLNAENVPGMGLVLKAMSAAASGKTASPSEPRPCWRRMAR